MLQQRAPCAGGQALSCGNCSVFVNWEGVGQVATKLPRRLEQARVKITYPNMTQRAREVLSGKSSVNLLGYLVNPARIRMALAYMKDNKNPWYEHIEIDEEALRELEEDFERHKRDNPIIDAEKHLSLSDVLDPLHEEDMRYSMYMDTDCVTPDIVPELLGQSYGTRPPPAAEVPTQPVTGTLHIPTVTVERVGQPCRAHEVPGLLGQAFPTLFEFGVGCDYRRFPNPLTTAQMLKHVMRLSDPRFAQHYRFLFFMVNIKNLEIAFKGVNALLKGGIVRRSPDGTYVDITEETLDSFASAVRG